MDAILKARSVVSLEWYSPGKVGRVVSTGFIWHRHQNRKCLSIITAYSPVKHPQLGGQNILVDVVFYDYTKLPGTVFHYDENLDLIMISVDTDLTVRPFGSVDQIALSDQPPYKSENIYSVFSTNLVLPNGDQSSAQFQYSQGFMADSTPNYVGEDRVHFHLPNVMDGCTGAPIIDAGTHELKAIIGTSEFGRYDAGGGKEVARHFGIPVTTIRNFIRAAEQKMKITP